MNSAGFISFLAYDDTLVEEYTTVSANEQILFIDKKENNAQRYLNALFLENTGDSVMYIQILPSDYVLVIPAGESRTYDLTKTNGIKVLGNSGQSLRWSGCFF